MELDYLTVAEHKALLKVGEITTVRGDYNLDITIDGEPYSDVEIHYHCFQIWGSQSHPHNKEEMAKAFSVGDSVLVLCDEDSSPKYVVGFYGVPPRYCEPIIVLRKLIDGVYDYWYYVMSLGQGYHEDPIKTAPTSPEIVTTWWTCDVVDEIEYYTTTAPTLISQGVGVCGDACGLINFETVDCCDAQQSASDDSDEWYTCPCGGQGGVGYEGVVCTTLVECSGGCDPPDLPLTFPGAKGLQSRTSNQSRNCDEGYSWDASSGGLAGIMEIGPRSHLAGAEGGTAITVTAATCTPIQTVHYLCEVFDDEQCACVSVPDPTFMGYDCGEGCSGWIQQGAIPSYADRWWFQAYGLGLTYQGCITYNSLVRSGSYTTKDVPLSTKITSGVTETTFDGSWTEYYFYNGVGTQTNVVKGNGSTCIDCTEDSSEGEEQSLSIYTYTEISYGMGGWSMVATSDDRVAVLIPKLSLAASTTAFGDGGSGSITSTTTVLLRIVEDSEHDYDLASGNANYSITGMLTDRYDIGIQPNCFVSRDLPLGVTLRGFHWHENFDWLLTAFEFDSAFYANLIIKEEGAWQEQDMSAFEAWVETNSLESYAMYLA